MMDVLSFTGKYIDEKMYLIAMGDELLMIDSVTCREAIEFVEKKHPKKITIVLTHEHIDHIYGVNYYLKNYRCEVICSRICGERIQKPAYNLAKYREVIFPEVSKVDIDLDYTCKATIMFDEFSEFMWLGHNIKLFETPGHSPGSICIMFDEKYIFTGDSLLLEYEVITRIPGGSKKEYQLKTLSFFKGLDRDLIVYPGHGRWGMLNDIFE